MTSAWAAATPTSPPAKPRPLAVPLFDVVAESVKSPSATIWVPVPT